MCPDWAGGHVRAVRIRWGTWALDRPSALLSVKRHDYTPACAMPSLSSKDPVESTGGKAT